jgi:glycosyltransferase involved in cell wall biosynthesis
MQPKPSVCFFNLSPAIPHMLLGEGLARAGGAELRASLLAKSLAQRGWPTAIAAYDYGQPAELQTPEGVRVLRASGARSGIQPIGLVRNALPADLRAFRAADADIYIETGVSWRSGLLARQCHKDGRKFVLWLANRTDPYTADRRRSQMPPHTRWLGHRGLRDAHMVVAQTEEQRELMLSIRRRECPVIPNIWSATPATGAKSASPEVLWAARFLGRKRPEWVVEVARRLPHIRFVMAGGPDRGCEVLFDSVRECAGRLPNLEVLGFVPFKEIDQYYARAWAFLSTSTVEGFPNTFLQAWNHKTPVVSTFDPDGVIRKHGLGAGCRDLDEVVVGLEMVCGDQRSVIGERCREYLERVHSVEAVMGALEPLLLSLVSG